MQLAFLSPFLQVFYNYLPEMYVLFWLLQTVKAAFDLRMLEQQQDSSKMSGYDREEICLNS